MRVLFLTHFFPPEIGAPQTRILETARNLRDFGHDVAVLTTFPNYPSGDVPPAYRGRYFMREEIDGIPVIRAWLYATPNRGFLRRTLSHTSFAVTALPAARRLPWKPDAIVVDMHPLFLCLTAAALGRFWKIPYVLNAGDLIPEQAIAYGAMRNPLAIRLSRLMANIAIRRAGQIVPFTRGIHDALLARGIPAEKLELIYFGADVNLFETDDRQRPMPEFAGSADKTFVVTYAGTHGLPHGLDTVLDVAERLREASDIRFLLAGDGSEKTRLVAEARRRGLDNVTFLDPLPRAKLPELYRRSDVCLVTLRHLDWLREYALSSKVFDAMAAGRPVIVAAEGETADVVRMANAGRCVPPESPEDLAAAILSLKADPEQRQQLGAIGRRYIQRHMTREQQSRRFEAVLHRATRRQFFATSERLPAFATIELQTNPHRNESGPRADRAEASSLDRTSDPVPPGEATTRLLEHHPDAAG